nr:hypothetical protein [Tanacetum cinerariifolium]
TSEQISAEHTSTTIAFTSGVSDAIPSSSCKRRKRITKKKVTPLVDVVDDALIKFDSASESDGDPSPYAPYAGWEILPTPFGKLAYSQLAFISSPSCSCARDCGWTSHL